MQIAWNKNFKLPVPDGESALGGDGEWWSRVRGLRGLKPHVL